MSEQFTKSHSDDFMKEGERSMNSQTIREDNHPCNKCENTNGDGPMEETIDGYLVHIRPYKPSKCEECKHKPVLKKQAA